jgi:hypothetical protein
MTRTATTGPWRIPDRYRGPLVVDAVGAVAITTATAVGSGRPLDWAVFALLGIVVLAPALRPVPVRPGRPAAAMLAGAVLAVALLLPVLPSPWLLKLFFALLIAGILAEVAAVVLAMRMQVRGLPTAPGGPVAPLDSCSGHGDVDRVLAASVALVLASTLWFPPADPRCWVPAALYVGAVAPVRVWWVSRAGAPTG